MLRVIIADDDRNARDKIVRFIDKEKYGIRIVGTASDGAEACAMIREQSPDIVLIDVEMPIMSGLEVINAIYHRHGMNNVVFIIVSSYDKFQYAREAIHLGVKDYLLKPFSPADICNAIYRAAQHIECTQIPKSETVSTPEILSLIPRWNIDMEYPYNEERTVMQHLRAGDQLCAQEALNAFFACLPQHCGERKDASEAAWNCLIILFIEIYHFAVISKLDACSPNLREDSMDTLDALKCVLTDFVLDLCTSLNDTKKHSSALQIALKFINAHYMERLTLERVAAEAFVSPAYLSTLFTQQLNMHFIDYIHKIRIENSIRLMKENPYLKYYEVGERVGYLSYKHYAKSFKKVMNMTVSQYFSRLHR